MPLDPARFAASAAAALSLFRRHAHGMIVIVWHLARAQARRLILLLTLLLLAAWLMLPYEMAWLAAIQAEPTAGLLASAQALSRWGDFYPGTLLLAAALAGSGHYLKRQTLQQAALACLLAAALSGLFVDVFRFGLGRARPNSGLADGFYGLAFSSKLHGFPSGHSTSAMATGVALAVAVPPLAVPALALGASVAWSRLYLNYHRPTDVFVGASIGSLFGLGFGLAARKPKASA